MCQAYEGERNYLMQKDAKDARATLSVMQEDARRLARYDEMFSLLKEAANDGWFSNKDLHDRLQAFLAAEGKVAG